MKKILLFAAACVALAACTKDEIKDKNAFEKGQVVTLTATAGVDTRVTSAFDKDATDNAITFKWEEGDQIKVTVDDSPSFFTVSKLIDGGTSAEFTGSMPEAGTTFKVDYPTSTPSLNAQTFESTTSLPKNIMPFQATDCSINVPFTLKPTKSVMRLNFYAVNQRTIGKIQVNNITYSACYTLTINGGVTVSSSQQSATPILIVVPNGAFEFSVSLFDTSESTSAFETINSNGEKSFPKATVVNMPAKNIGTPE